MTKQYKIALRIELNYTEHTIYHWAQLCVNILDKRAFPVWAIDKMEKIQQKVSWNSWILLVAPLSSLQSRIHNMPRSNQSAISPNRWELYTSMLNVFTLKYRADIYIGIDLDIQNYLQFKIHGVCTIQMADIQMGFLGQSQTRLDYFQLLQEECLRLVFRFFCWWSMFICNTGCNYTCVGRCISGHVLLKTV